MVSRHSIIFIMPSGLDVKRRAVVLFSGCLNSMLSVRVLQLQFLEGEGVNIRTPFSCCGWSTAEMTAYLQMPLIHI
jgi:tRNA U34 2-thiouridine synthase MnmA/TrmU